MSNRITNVTIPDSVQAGQEFAVTVQYSADNDGTLEISYSGTFDGTPTSVSLAANEQSVTFEMTVVRYGTAPSCQVQFDFGDEWPVLLEVK